MLFHRIGQHFEIELVQERCRKRHFETAEIVENHAKRPNVRLDAVLDRFYPELRSEIIWRANVFFHNRVLLGLLAIRSELFYFSIDLALVKFDMCLPLWDLSGATKVTDLHFVILLHEHVHAFQIAVQESDIVQVLHAQTEIDEDLPDDVFGKWFANLLLLFN